MIDGERRARVEAESRKTPSDGRPGERSLGSSATLVAVANTAAGGLNYLFALSLSFVLTKSDYVVASAGNSLLLIVGTAAMSSAAWALAHKLAAEPGTPAQQREVISAALFLATIQGLAMGLLCLFVAHDFASTWPQVAIVASAVVASVGVVSKGITQGLNRFGLLAVLIVGEVMVKITVSMTLVGIGGGAAGALAGTAAGALVLVVVALAWVLPHRLRFSRTTLVPMWRSSMGMVVIQGLVATVMAMDLLTAAGLSDSSAASASYQLAAVIGRSPAFLAAAVAAVYFPAIARQPFQVSLRRDSMSMTLRLVLPAVAVLVTVPGPVITALMPAGYAAVNDFLPYTAISGLLFAGITVTSSWLCATARFARGASFLLLGALLDMAAVIEGKYVGGLQGVAIGAVAGAAIALALLLVAGGSTVSLQFRQLGVPLSMALVLLLSARVPVLWCSSAIIVGIATITSTARFTSAGCSEVAP